jgi:predicted dehydrogenase
MNDMLGLGIVGYGHFGVITAEEYARLPHIEIVGVAESDSQRRRLAADRFAVPTYETLDDLLANPEVDIVVLNTPPWLHGPQALRAARARKHLFVEKPLATSLADAQQVLEVVAENGLKLSVNYVMRHVALYQKLHALAASGLFGRMVYLSLENDASNEALHDRHWFWDHSKSGGIFVEHGVHFFDLGRRLASSRAETIAGFASKEADGRENRVLASVQYGTGAHATHYHAFDRPGALATCALHTVFERGVAHSYGWIPQRLEIEGQTAPEGVQQLAHLISGPLTLREAQPPPGVLGSAAGLIVSATMERPSKDEEYRKAARCCMADFAHAIRDPDWTPQVQPDDAYESLRVAVAARESADRKQSA